jgi:hypothetical protein
MILKGSQRGSGAQLAAHLLNVEDNDHIEVHQLRGFLADDLAGAFAEIEATALGTKCQQPFFSVSINPPAEQLFTSTVSMTAFEAQAAKNFGDEMHHSCVVVAFDVTHLIK